MHEAQHYVIFSNIPNFVSLSLKYLRKYSSLKVKEKVLQLYDATAFICINSKFLGNERDDKIFSSEYEHAFPISILRLISTGISFVFVTVTPRYLNFYKF